MAIYGLKQLQRKLRNMPAAARKAANDNVIEAANEVAALQKSLAPVDDGDLKESVHVTLPGGTTPPYSQPGGSTTARESQAIITAGNTKVRYAHLVEFGTKAHINGGKFAGTEHPGTTAQPFFWPAYRALRGRARGKITRGIKKAITDVATSGGT